MTDVRIGSKTDILEQLVTFQPMRTNILSIQSMIGLSYTPHRGKSASISKTPAVNTAQTALSNLNMK